MRFAGRPVTSVDEMAFDFNGDDYLDPVEEEELMRSLNDEDEDDDWDSDGDFDDDDF